MNDKELKKIHEMMLDAVSDALCISMRAVALQIDAKRLESDLRTEIALAIESNAHSTVSIQLSKDV
ncbi:MAG TPA: hypothetical protein DCO68_10280, partial [Methylophilaceae bacterium]|nr:hypothetical protein [Methylophilaceae bacterium]